MTRAAHTKFRVVREEGEFDRKGGVAALLRKGYICSVTLDKSGIVEY